jgi:hypothetical protein
MHQRVNDNQPYQTQRLPTASSLTCHKYALSDYREAFNNHALKRSGQDVNLNSRFIFEALTRAYGCAPLSNNIRAAISTTACKKNFRTRVSGIFATLIQKLKCIDLQLKYFRHDFLTKTVHSSLHAMRSVEILRTNFISINSAYKLLWINSINLLNRSK